MRSLSAIVSLESFLALDKRYETAIGLHFHLKKNSTNESGYFRVIDRLKEQYSAGLLLPSLISITDCNSIEAASAARRMPRFANHPLSLEWVVPFGPSNFHLGIHNLPEGSGERWHSLMDEFTEGTGQVTLEELLIALHKHREVLIVLNHPFWDFTAIGTEKHLCVLRQFLHLYSRWIHAIEYNARRSSKENKSAILLSEQYGLPVVSGEDIHRSESGRIVNVTAASTFSEFVAEVRWDKRSEVVLLRSH